MKALFTKKKIRGERSLGDKLKFARKKKDINLEQAEKDTKISMKYLFALEHSRFDQLPADVYVYGFLTRYGDYLGLNKQDVIKNYDAEKKIFDCVKLIKKHPDQKNKNLLKPELSKEIKNSPKFFITPELVISICVGFMVIALLGYIWMQVKSFAAAPPLEVQNEEAEIVVSMDEVNIAGKTDSGADLSINGEAVAIGADGTFSQDVELVKGINKIEIIARNKANKETKKTIQVLSK